MKKKRKTSIPDMYMNWIRYDILRNPDYDSYRYEKLLYTLLGMQFVPYDEMDKNRLSDAKSLKYRFAKEKGFDDSLVDISLESFGSSVLEVMVSLALRLYSETTFDFPIPMTPSQIFWSMIESLHLEGQVDSEFYEDKVIFTIQMMMTRQFEKNGDGGLFRVSKNSPHDMTKADIWYQAQWWITDAWNGMVTLS